MARAALATRVRKLERARGTRRATDPHEGHTWFSQEAVAHWFRGDRAKGLEFARAYAKDGQCFQSKKEEEAYRPIQAALRELVVVMTPDRPFAFDLLPRGLQAMLRDKARKRIERILQAPATPLCPYGNNPLSDYIQDGPPRLALTRERLDGAKTHWDKLVERSDAMCRELGLEPQDWSGVVDWEWYYAHAVPAPGSPSRLGEGGGSAPAG